MGTHRRGGRLRDGAVVVLLEVNVQLDDAVSVRDKQQLSAEPGCGCPAPPLQGLPVGRAAHSPAGAAHEPPPQLLPGTWKKFKSATGCEGRRCGSEVPPEKALEHLEASLGVFALFFSTALVGLEGPSPPPRVSRGALS